MTFQRDHCQGVSHPVPRVEEFRCGDLSLYDIAEYFSGHPHFAFLDSRLQENGLGKYSFIAFDPFLIFRSKGNRVWITAGDGRPVKEETAVNSFAALNRVMTSYRIPRGWGCDAAPFLGGGIGYLSYELGRQIEVLPATTRDVTGIPESYLCFYNAVIVYNHPQEKMYISYFDPCCPSRIGSLSQLKAELAAIPAGLYDSRPLSPGWKTLREESDLWRHFRRDFSRREYMDAIDRIKEYILGGDIYQADLTQRFETDMEDIQPWELYKRLMHINPAPFAAYLNFDGVQVVSSSPERFLAVKDRYVETRPVKGTVKRGSTPAEDRKNREFLLKDEKNRAELAMIVDLLRNDIGRVCQAGSVKVKAFPELESYASMHHLVSTITGRLAEGKNIIDLLNATFPGGSITGAPKIRAMEILDQLEPVERGIYTGTIGYLGFNGCADLNIVIRTVIVTGNKAHIQAGGGIVADSLAGDEYDETLLKAQKLFNAFVRDTKN
jgi:para-aminobenzoate synthetase component I